LNIIQSIILGFVQGITEFLPISSSGHLVLVSHFFNWNIPPKEAFYFNVLVQSATLIAVIIFFWNELLEIIKDFTSGILSKQTEKTKKPNLGWQIIFSTIPTAVVGLLLMNYVEKAFSSPLIVGIFLLFTALLLLIAEKTGKRHRVLKDLNWKDAIWIGFFQSLAIFPGVSRSGASITGGMTKNFNREAATRFSFLISIPIMILASIATILDITDYQEFLNYLPVFIPGFLTALVTGYLSIRWLLNYLKRNSFYPFVIYCILLGIIVIITSI
jgi:undecaprenyl-diphosphatase